MSDGWKRAVGGVTATVVGMHLAWLLTLLVQTATFSAIVLWISTLYVPLAAVMFILLMILLFAPVSIGCLGLYWGICRLLKVSA